MFRIILASKSKVRLDILKNNKIDCIAVPSNIDEEEVKNRLLKEEQVLN